MRSVKEKLSNAASAGKKHVDIYKAQAQEKAEKATARTKEEEVIAHEQRKAKEAEAKMNLHEAKSEHAADKLYGKHSVPLHRHDLTITTTSRSELYPRLLGLQILLEDTTPIFRFQIFVFVAL